MKTEKKRILIVVDDAMVTRLLKVNLEETSNYIVQVENASTAALSAAQSFKPDLILLDVMMPGIDGGELANTFHISTELTAIPIVFFTAATTKQEVAAHQGRIGGYPFLAKPADLAAVIACLEQQFHISQPKLGNVSG